MECELRRGRGFGTGSGTAALAGGAWGGGREAGDSRLPCRARSEDGLTGGSGPRTRDHRAVQEIARIFFRIGQAVHLDALERILAGIIAHDPWNRWARQTIEDDLGEIRRLLAYRVLEEGGDRQADDAVDHFLARRAHALKRVLELTRTLETDSDRDLTFFMVVVRQVETLAAPPG